MSLEDKMAKLSKKFDTYNTEEYDTTGSIIFDAVLSDGKGMPKGAFVELASQSGVGKSTLCLFMCKTYCSRGKVVVYLDYEHGVNGNMLRSIGLEPYLGKNFFLFQVTTFEEGEEIIDSLKDDGIDMFIVDSVTAMLPSKLQEGSIGDVLPGIQARYTALFLSKYKAVAQKSKITFVFINQVRVKLNFRGMSTEDSAGGNAQKFYMDTRLFMRKTKKLERDMETLDGKSKVEYGCDAVLVAKKNRYAKPFVEGPITIYYGKGPSNLSSYVKWLEGKGYIKRAAWTTITWKDQEYKVRGQEGIIQWVKEHMGEVKQAIDEEGGLVLAREMNSEDSLYD